MPHCGQKKFCTRVRIVTARCRLLCDDLDSGAEFFGEDLAFHRHSSISCGICESQQQGISQENSLLLALRRRCSFCQITLASLHFTRIVTFQFT